MVLKVFMPWFRGAPNLCLQPTSRKVCMMKLYIALSIVLTLSTLPVSAETSATRTLEYAPAPVNNPLKGLVPYAGEKTHWFPHSMEFSYLPLSALVTGKDQYDWGALEKLLNNISGRGHQAIFRVYLEYPGKKNSIPQYLVKMGLKIYRWKSRKTNLTPDYSDRNLRKCLQNFIATLGKKYDGDPRIGFITAGLLGKWGEWHTYPRNDLWASKEVQEEVMDAYEKAFKITPVLLRYPAGENHYALAANSKRKFGYHDDSFAWATLDTGKKGDEWFFLTAMKEAGPDALDKWKKYPIGGEIRPEAWGKVFDEKPDDKRIQNFEECIEKTHVTWLMDSGMFQKKTWTKARRKRAEKLVQRMGYEFHVRRVTWTRKDDSLDVAVEVENRGIAPFYYDWPIEFALLSENGVVKTFAGKGKLTGLLPGDEPRVWRGQLNIAGVVSGRYQLAVRIRNPLSQGTPLRFANTTQDQHLPGWLTLTAVTW